MASSFFQLSSFVSKGNLPLLRSLFIYNNVNFQSMFSSRSIAKLLSSQPQRPIKLKQKEACSATIFMGSIYQHHLLAIEHPVFRNQCVCYSSKKSKSKQKSAKRGADTDDETDDEEQVDDDDSEGEEDEIDGATKDWKNLKMNVPSLRIDAVLSSGLGVSRKKVEEAFLGGKLRHNGKKVMKKSQKVLEGDVLDVVKENSIVNKEGNQVMLVMRVQMRKIRDEKTSTNKTPVKLRRWKHLEVPKEK